MTTLNAVTSSFTDDYVSTVNQTQEMTQYSLAETLYMTLNRVLLPFIIFVGLTGNCLSIAVLLKPKKKQSSSVYLVALCVADSLFLVQLISIWLAFVEIYIYHKPGFCQLLMYLAYVSSFLSVSTVAAFTVERYIVVADPLKIHTEVSTRRALLVVASLTAVAAVLYGYQLWGTEVRDEQCSPKIDYLKLHHAMSYVDTALTLFVPTPLILSMNVRILYILAKRSRATPNQQQVPSSDATSTCQMLPLSQEISMTSFGTSVKSADGEAGGHKHREAVTSLKTTRTLVTISTIFIILNAPHHLLRLYTAVSAWLSDEPPSFPPAMAYAQQAALFIYYTNFAINFFLYGLCGSNFRRDLRSMLCTAVCRGDRANSTERNGQASSKNPETTTMTLRVIPSRMPSDETQPENKDPPFLDN